METLLRQRLQAELKVLNDEVELNIRAVHSEVCAYVTGFFELPQCALHADLLG